MFFASVYSFIETGASYMEFLIAAPVISKAVQTNLHIKGKKAQCESVQKALKEAAGKQIIFIAVFAVLISAVCTAVTDIQVLVPLVLCLLCRYNFLYAGGAKPWRCQW